MKTKRVRPVLVESKETKSQNLPLYTIGTCIKQLSDVKIGELQLIQRMMFPFEYFQPMELILISLEDEKIETNIDDCINIGGNINDSFIFKPSLEVLNNPYIKKVITRQSQISPEYISKFIEQYNNGCVEDLEIEMKHYWVNSDGIKGDFFTEVAKFESSINQYDAILINHPKLTNGFVTIVEKSDIEKQADLVEEIAFDNLKIKEPITYTEEEVKHLLLKCQSEVLYPETHYEPCNSDEDNEKIFLSEFNEWFKQNKKK